MPNILSAKDPKAIDAAAKLLKQDDVVVIPTDTIYGLAGNAFSESGIAKIFSVKSRSREKPLIVYVESFEHLHTIVSHLPESASEALSHLWPGALSVILNKNEKIPDIVTSRKKTIAVRIPDHTLCLELLKRVGCPIAVTSANISKMPTHKTAPEVAEQLADRVSLVLDGGPSHEQIPSTLMDYTQSPPLLLRNGVLPFEYLKHFIPDLKDITADWSED